MFRHVVFGEDTVQTYQEIATFLKRQVKHIETRDALQVFMLLKTIRQWCSSNPVLYPYLREDVKFLYLMMEIHGYSKDEVNRMVGWS